MIGFGRVRCRSRDARWSTDASVELLEGKGVSGSSTLQRRPRATHLLVREAPSAARARRACATGRPAGRAVPVLRSEIFIEDRRYDPVLCLWVLLLRLRILGRWVVAFFERT